MILLQKEVGSELDEKVDSLDRKLLKENQFEERNNFFKKANQLKDEYIEKLRRYKETLGRKPSEKKEITKRKL